MYLRAVPLTLLPVLLFMVAPVAVRTCDIDRFALPATACIPGSPRIDAKRAATLTENKIIDFLASPETTNEEIALLLAALGRFEHSREAVNVLIYWLVFEDWGGSTGTQNNETIPLPCPAEESLKQIGVFAIPQLVKESVLFFENTTIAAAKSRHGGLQGDRHGNIFEVQKQNGYRISCLRCILHHTPETSAHAAECAWNLMAAKPDDDRVQRACRDICMQLQQIHWDERKQLFGSFSRNADGAMLTPDRVAIAELLDDFLRDPEERTERIAKLTQFKNSPIVISELVHWLEFQPNGPYPLGPPDSKRRLEDCPAAVALAQFGPAAATQLVGDYLFYFENTDIDNNRKRMFRREQKDERGVELEKQDPTPRLKLIATVLAQTPETARKAVDYAIKRSGTPEADARVQRGCRALIDEIVSQFPKADRPDIFPQSVLGR